jgi:outer membrane protein
MKRASCVGLVLLFAAVAGRDAVAEDLLDIYELALQGDPQLAGAGSNLLARRESVPQARAALLPHVNGSAAISRSDSRSSSSSTQDAESAAAIAPGKNRSSSVNTNRSISISLSQSIYDHGNWLRLRSARARVEQADREFEAVADQLIVRTAEAYFAALTAMQGLASARAQEIAIERQLDQADFRLRSGMSPITDVHDARAARDNARAAVILAENAVEDANQALAEMTGEPLTRLKALDENFQPAPPTPADEEAWVRQALRANPQLRAAERALDAADHEVGAARAGHYPRLSASASYNRSITGGSSTSNGIESPSDGENDGTTITLSLDLPIFSGGAVRSSVRQATYARDATSHQLEQQRRAIARQTRRAYHAVVSGISEIEARRAALVSARSAYEASEVGLQVGTRTIVEVLIAQQNLFTAEREYAGARHDFLVNTLRLKQAAGSISIDDLRAVNDLLTADARTATRRGGRDGAR